MKKYLIHKISIFLALILLITSSYIIFIYPSKSNIVVATINGNPISLKEIQMRSTGMQAEVINYFHEKYKAEYDKDFWYKSFDGEVPIEVLCGKCLEDAVWDNIQLIYAKDKGFIKDISYAAFLSELKDENKRRKNAVKKKEPVYGPIEYDEAGYYILRLANLVEEKVKLYLLENEFKLTEDEFKKLYDMNRDAKYKISDVIKIEKITMDFSEEKDISNAIINGKAFAEQVRSQYTSGTGFDELAKLNKNDKVALKCEEIVFEAPEKGYLYSIVSKMKENDVSDMQNGPNQLYFIRCISRNEMGYKKQSDVKTSIEKDYVNEKYDALIKRLYDEAEVEVNRANLDMLKI